LRELSSALPAQGGRILDDDDNDEDEDEENGDEDEENGDEDDDMEEALAQPTPNDKGKGKASRVPSEVPREVTPLRKSERRRAN
jgi:hypothetical protein